MSDPVLDQVIVQLSDTREITLSELLRGWQAHVQRIREEQTLDLGSGWTAHDLVAALLLRDRISASLSSQPAEVRAAAAGALSEADELFSEISIDDTQGIVRRFAEDVGSTATWWWSRLPRTGPIRADLDDWERRQKLS